MEQTKLDRINELARIAKLRALTEEESAERDTLRKEYIAENGADYLELADIS